MKVEIGDYISFWKNDHVIYKVLDKHKNCILIKDENNISYWEDINYIEKVMKVGIKDVFNREN